MSLTMLGLGAESPVAEPLVLAELLPDALDWSQGLELVRLACGDHIRWSYARLREWATHLDSDFDARLKRLPKTHQQRLVLAPQFSYWLQKPIQAEDGAEISRAIQFEECLAHAMPQTVACGSWTAFGDLRAGPSGEGGYVAPRVQHIVVDGRSPFSLYGYPEQWGEVEPHNEEELSTIVGRLCAAIDEMTLQCPLAAATVKASVQVVSVVRAPQFPELTSSMSTRKIIGRMSLTNAHSSKWSIRRIENAMVHEAIHSLIYKLELRHPLYVDDGAAWRLTAVSPWSGRTLFLHSFVHACFVWYGLWNYWRVNIAHDEESREFLNKAQSGFVTGELLAQLPIESRACITSQTQSAISTMTRRVQAAT